MRMEVLHVSFVPDFLTMTQNPSIDDLRFEEFTVTSLDNFMDGDRDSLLLCPIRTLRSTCPR